MTSLLLHGLLGLALIALLSAALRVASMTGARGLDRVLATAPIAAAAAILWALGLGLVGLGTTPLALAAGAGATWLAARRLPAEVGPRPLEELRSWWTGLGTSARVALGALGGLALAYTAFLLRYPAIGDDGLNYHLPAIAGWVVDGAPGTQTDYFDDLPTGSYPITNEVLLSWSVGLSRGLVPITVWPVITLALLAAGIWRGLRLLEVGRGVSALAAAMLITSPIVVLQVPGPNTDLPAAAWLAVCVALCAGARARPALLAPALLAAALAVGTKTTPAAPALCALIVAGIAVRPSLRGLAWPLALAAVVGTIVGGTWFVRNLIEHGSPLWPLVASSFGDPLPFVLRQIDGRLIADLGSIPPRADGYARALGGAVVVLAAALLAPLARPRREVVLATSVAVLCVLVWASAPYTGYPRGEEYDFSATNAVRYLLPSLAAAVLAVALVARRSGSVRLGAAIAVLVAAVAWNVERDIALGFPFLPSAVLLGAGALAGGVAGLAVRRLPSVPAAPVVAAAAVVLSALLALPAAGYVDRHLRVDAFAEGSARWIADRPGFAGGDRPVASVGTVNGALAGDHLRHPVRLLPAGESCPELRRRVRSEWLVLPQPRIVPGLVAPPASVRRLASLHRCLTVLEPGYADEFFAVYGPR